MLSQYLDNAIKTAKYEILEDDGSIYAEIPECNGVYANSQNFEDCRNQLIEVLEEWIFIRLRKNLNIPVINNINLNVLESVDASL